MSEFFKDDQKRFKKKIKAIFSSRTQLLPYVARRHVCFEAICGRYLTTALS